MQYKSDKRDKSDKCDQSESVRMNRVAVETYILSVCVHPSTSTLTLKRTVSIPTTGSLPAKWPDRHTATVSVFSTHPSNNAGVVSDCSRYWAHNSQPLWCSSLVSVPE